MASVFASVFLMNTVTVTAMRLVSNNLASSDLPFRCSCHGLSAESQFVRMMKLNYASGDLQDAAQTWNLGGCYDFQRLGYTLPFNGVVDYVLSYTRWSGDHVMVGRCNSDPDMCVAVFPGANGFDQVAGTADYAPTALLRKMENGTVEYLSRVEATEFPADEVYHYHKRYSMVYKHLRQQVGAAIQNSLQSCKRIEAIGHSIGAALASLWQWENQELPIDLFAAGPNLAWFGRAPDVGCRGITVYNEYDRVPQFRYYVDQSDGSRVRTAKVPYQKLLKIVGKYVPMFSDCVADPPSKEYWVLPSIIFPSNYFMALNPGLPYHDLNAYIAAVDQAFP